MNLDGFTWNRKGEWARWKNVPRWRQAFFFWFLWLAVILKSLQIKLCLTKSAAQRRSLCPSRSKALPTQGLLIENHTNKEYSYGMEYTIEQKRGDKWYSFDEEKIVESLAALLKPNETNEFSVTWKEKLPPGTYRVGKACQYQQGEWELGSRIYCAIKSFTEGTGTGNLRRILYK